MAEGVTDRRCSGIVCAIPTCLASKRQNPNRKFYKFPDRKSPLFEIWLAKCGIEHSQKKILRVCEIHFLDEVKGKNKLKKNAIPVMHLKDPYTSSDDEVPLKFKDIKTYSKSGIITNTQDLKFEDLCNMPTSSSYVLCDENVCPSACNDCKKSFSTLRKYQQLYLKALKNVTLFKKRFVSRTILLRNLKKKCIVKKRK